MLSAPLVQSTPVGALVDHLLENVGPLAFAGAAPDLVTLEVEGADVEMVAEAHHLENRLVARIAEAEVAHGSHPPCAGSLLS
jgi:hypothetical protein